MPEPIDIGQEAIGEHVKAFALEIGRDKSLIYKWLSDAEFDPYTRFVAYLRAAHKVNPAGAELLFQDLQSRYFSLKDGDLIRDADWDETLADALKIMAEAVRTRKGSTAFKIEVSRVIRTLEWLLKQQATDEGT